MKMRYTLLPLFLLCGMAFPAVAADTKVTLSNVHLCCGACVTGAKNAVAQIRAEGAAAAGAEGGGEIERKAGHGDVHARQVAGVAAAHEGQDAGIGVLHLVAQVGQAMDGMIGVAGGLVHGEISLVPARHDPRTVHQPPLARSEEI